MITGSLRYMAPEVALGKPYNLKADVFSFGILLWEILSLQKPFLGYNARIHKKIVLEHGVRPEINPKWSKNIKSLLFESWQEEINKRPHFEDISEILNNELYNKEGINSGTMDCSNRTARSF